VRGVRTCKVKEWTKMDGVVCLAVGVSWDRSDGRAEVVGAFGRYPSCASERASSGCLVTNSFWSFACYSVAHFVQSRYAEAFTSAGRAAWSMDMLSSMRRSDGIAFSLAVPCGLPWFLAISRPARRPKAMLRRQLVAGGYSL